MLVVCGLLFILLTACGKESDQTLPNGQLAADSDADLTFICSVPPNTLDPQKMSWHHDLRIANALYEPLLRYKLPQLTLEGGVAANWQISEDQKTHTFNLRPQAKWSNGDPVVARDFVTAWRRALLPDFAADYVQLLFCIEGAQDFFNWRQAQLAAHKPADSSEILWDKTCERFGQTVGITAVTDHQLVVTLQRPTPYFPELCAFATFMPNHTPSLEQALTFDTQTGMLKMPPAFWTDAKNLITNGPYQLASYRFKQDLLLIQNPHWWNKDSMQNTSIRQKIIENAQASFLAYENKEADWVPGIPSTTSFAADLVATGRKDVHTTPWAGTYFYSFNCQPTLANGSPNPLSDPRVRQALSMTIDRKTIVSKITRMNQTIAQTFVPPGMIPNYLPPTADGTVFDPQGARRLLKQAGYEDPSKLRGLSILMNTDGGHEAIAQAISHMWKTHLGIDVPLQSMEVRSFREKLKHQHYTVARASWIADYRDPTTFLDKYRSDSGNNDSKWLNKQYDQLLNEASQQTDPLQRIKALKKAESLLISEQAIAPIFHYITLDVYDPTRVKNLHLNAWSFYRLEQIQVVK
ncbi:MAG: peptide ABC transporter substrate-binding protein [Phycisphaeraceae bacterium]|nr:peptide ABC transporter substrate-binding protein [Phycisphaeraceae bacterium]